LLQAPLRPLADASGQRQALVAQDQSESDFFRELAALTAQAPLDHYFTNLHTALSKYFEAPIMVAAIADRSSPSGYRARYQRSLTDRDSIPAIDERYIAAALEARKPLRFGTAKLPTGGFLRSTSDDNGSQIVAPMLVQGQCVGYLALRHPMVGMFGERELTLATAASNVAGLVVRAKFSDEDAETSAKEVRFMLETARALSSERDMSRLFARFHGLVAGVMDAETFWIALGSWERSQSRIAYCIRRHRLVTLDRPIPLEGSVSGHVFRECAKVQIRNARDWAQFPVTESDRDGVRSALIVPMKIGARAIGAISVQSSQFNAYTDRDADMLAAIAEQAAIAVMNSEAIEFAEARARELSLLSEVSRAMTTQLSLPALCKAVCEHVRRTMDAPVSFVALQERESDSIVIQHCVRDGVARHIGEARPLAGTMAHQVLQTGHPVLLKTTADIDRHEGARLLDAVSADMGSMLVVPLRLHGSNIGVLSAQSRNENAYEDSDIRVLLAVADHLALAVENAKLFNDARNRAERDPLTNLFHHRYLKTRLEEEIIRSKKTGKPVAVVMMDLDNFKLVNDTYGHLVGDDALRMATSVLLGACRSNDVVGRYGGDEFMVILPDTDRTTAMAVADRVGSDLASRHLTCSDGRRIPIRASAGVAVFPEDGETAPDVIATADAALYQSKRHGRPIGTLQHVGSNSMHLIGDFSAVSELLAALIFRDPATREHLEHVNQVAWNFAQSLGMNDEDRESLLLASVLHDVGKIAIPDRVLRKPGKLSADEYELVRRHPTLGAALIEHMPGYAVAALAVRYHHESYDGSGYPDGLAGEQIPLIARIVSLIDVYSALILDRPYHKGLSNSEALAELRRCSGTQFDPVLVERFACMIESSRAD
jgi:diguanylate cyclase (GGDEF)-like protein